ncbi:hypothetical protein ACFLR2_00825 [Chlamydiota bacterium]
MASAPQPAKLNAPVAPTADSKSTHHPCGYLLVALGIIGLIGSLVASGYFYSQLGYISHAIGGGGVAFAILCLLLNGYCCTKTETPIQTSQPVRAKPAPRRNPRGQPQALPPQLPPARSSQPTAPALPPLPHILTLEPEASSPLLHSLSEKDFQTPGPNTRFLLLSAALTASAKVPSLEDLGYVVDDDLLNIFLTDWIMPESRSKDDYFQKQCRTIKESRSQDPEGQKCIACINSRIEDFDKEIQLKERLKRLRSSPLKVRDLLPAWPNSRLQLRLMMDDELCLQTISFLSQMSDAEAWELIGSRPLRLSAMKKGCVAPPHTTQEEMDTVLLVDLPHFTAAQINACPSFFPPLTFVLISADELKRIDTSRLSTGQLQPLFTKFVQYLTPAQVNAVIRLITDKTLFASLSEAQVLGFDDSQMDQEIFNILFSTEGDHFSNAHDLLPQLSLQRIYQLSKFFSDEHWKYLGKEHTLAFDFSQIEESKRQEVFNILFSTEGDHFSNAHDLLPQLTLPRIYQLSQFFSDEHWNYLGKDHTLAFDFSKIDESERQRVFGILFSTEGNSYSKAYGLLPELSLQQIYQLSQFFSDEHWKLLGKEHTLAFDFSQIEESERKRVFGILFSEGDYHSKAYELLPQLPLQRIYSLSKFFSKEHWELLGDAHTLAFDFTQIKESERERVFGILFSEGEFYSKAALLLPQLSAEKKAFIRPYLSAKALAYLDRK